MNPGAQLICVANIKLSAAHAVAQSEAFHKLGPSVSVSADLRPTGPAAHREGTARARGAPRARVPACACRQARAPSAGKCTKRWKVHEPRTARISRRALLPPRATACARCSSRLSDGTGSCINQRQTRTAGSRAAAVGLARQTLQIASAGDAGSRAERWKVHEALESARAEDGADFEACASATAGDRLCALLLALERRHWQLHQPAPDAHSWLACSCRRARAPNAANCISRGCRLARRALESARSAGKCTSRGRA